MSEIFRAIATILFGVRETTKKDYTAKMVAWEDLGDWNNVKKR